MRRKSWRGVGRDEGVSECIADGLGLVGVRGDVSVYRDWALRASFLGGLRGRYAMNSFDYDFNNRVSEYRTRCRLCCSEDKSIVGVMRPTDTASLQYCSFSTDFGAYSTDGDNIIDA
jgi:hypothetical protein